MNLSTIEMTREEAEVALQEWADGIKSRHTEEDEAIAQGYELLAAGKSLLSLSDTIRAGGQDEGLRPRLAVAPVTADVVYLERDRIGSVRFCLRDRPGVWGRDVGPAGVRVEDVLPAVTYEEARSHDLETWRGCQWRAMVPIVPPRFRARGWRGAHVLFEAEWAKHTPPAPVDPALIRHVRGDLWVVLGVWDLTPLERAVLTERNRA